MQELVINHLTDDAEPMRRFAFGNTRFVAFLDLGKYQAQSRIAYLGADIDDKDLSVTIICHDASYKKRNRSAMHKWSVQKFTIEPFSDLKNKLGDIKKAFLVELDSDDTHLRNPRRQPAILFQTSLSIFFSERNLTRDVLKENLNMEEFDLIKI